MSVPRRGEELFQQGNPLADVLLDLPWSYPEESTVKSKEATVTVHVDIIRNDWHAGHQTLVARAFVRDSTFVLEPLDDNKDWIEVVSRPFISLSVGRELYPEKDPELFIANLHEAMHGSYLFATEAHESFDCEYVEHISTIPVRDIEPGVPKRPSLWRRKVLRQG